MSKLYTAPERMIPLVKEVHDTLFAHCEKDVPVKMELNPQNVWFKVLSDPRQQRDGILRTEGALMLLCLSFTPIRSAPAWCWTTPVLTRRKRSTSLIQLVAVYRIRRGLLYMNTHRVTK
jgi:hypothetical protein